MNKLRLLAWPFFLLFLVIPATQAQTRLSRDLDGDRGRAAQDPQSVTVDVDCDAGDSIADALLTPAPELIVNITGLCEEDVEIRRNDVTLIGTDPALDGIRAAGGTSVLTVRGAGNVRIEKLKIDAPTSRVFIGQQSDEVQIVGCDLGQTRVEVTQRSSLRFDETRLGDLLVDLGSKIYSFGSSMQDVRILDGSFAYLSTGFPWGPFGPPRPAARVIEVARSSLKLWRAEISRSLSASNSTVTLESSQVTLNLTLSAASYLHVENADVWGNLIVSEFSKVWVLPGATLTSNLVCLPSGDADCDETNVRGFVQGCPTCEASSGTPNLVTFRFDGTLYRVPDELSGELSIGDPFSISYTFNAATPGNHGGFYNAVWTVSMSIGDRTWTEGIGSIQVYDDDPYIGDYYSCNVSDFLGPLIGGHGFQWVELFLRDSSGTAFSSMDSLPVVPPEPFDADTTFVEIAIGHFIPVRSTIDSATVVRSP